MILCLHFVNCTHYLHLWQDEMLFSLSRRFILKIYKKVIHVLWRKTYFNDELLFSKTVIYQIYVHCYFPHRLHNLPLFLNRLWDWLKNRSDLLRRKWDYLVQVIAKMVKNSGFESKFYDVPFFSGQPCISRVIFPE